MAKYTDSQREIIQAMIALQDAQKAPADAISDFYTALTITPERDAVIDESKMRDLKVICDGFIAAFNTDDDSYSFDLIQSALASLPLTIRNLLLDYGLERVIAHNKLGLVEYFVTAGANVNSATITNMRGEANKAELFMILDQVVQSMEREGVDTSRYSSDFSLGSGEFSFDSDADELSAQAPADSDIPNGKSRSTSTSTVSTTREEAVETSTSSIYASVMNTVMTAVDQYVAMRLEQCKTATKRKKKGTVKSRTLHTIDRNSPQPPFNLENVVIPGIDRGDLKIYETLTQPQMLTSIDMQIDGAIRDFTSEKATEKLTAEAIRLEIKEAVINRMKAPIQDLAFPSFLNELKRPLQGTESEIRRTREGVLNQLLGRQTTDHQMECLRQVLEPFYQEYPLLLATKEARDVLLDATREGSIAYVLSTPPCDNILAALNDRDPTENDIRLIREAITLQSMELMLETQVKDFQDTMMWMQSDIAAERYTDPSNPDSLVTVLLPEGQKVMNAISDFQTHGVDSSLPLDEVAARAGADKVRQELDRTLPGLGSMSAERSVSQAKTPLGNGADSGQENQVDKDALGKGKGQWVDSVKRQSGPTTGGRGSGDS